MSFSRGFAGNGLKRTIGRRTKSIKFYHDICRESALSYIVLDISDAGDPEVLVYETRWNCAHVNALPFWLRTPFTIAARLDPTGWKFSWAEACREFTIVGSHFVSLLLRTTYPNQGYLNPVHADHSGRSHSSFLGMTSSCSTVVTLVRETSMDASQPMTSRLGMCEAISLESSRRDVSTGSG